MELVFNIFILVMQGLGYLVAGLVVLIFLIIIFGKNQENRYDLEAEFKDENDREFADFDIKLWRYVKQAGDYQLKANFSWKEPRLSIGDKVSVYLNDVLVLEGSVEKASSISLNNKHLQNTPNNPKQGDECRVLLNGNLELKQDVVDD